jgi:hypothetical protein
MEGCTLTVHWDDSDRFPAAFVDTKASEADDGGRAAAGRSAERLMSTAGLLRAWELLTR